MNPAMILAFVALVASIVLVFQPRWRGVSALAVVLAAIEVLRAIRIVSFGVRGVPVVVVLGGGLAIAGIALFTRVTAKPAVAAATALGLVGLIQVLNALLG